MELDDLFRAKIGSNPEYLEVTNIIKESTTGNVWMIGKTILRALASQTTGPLEQIDPDLSFVTDTEGYATDISKDWGVIRTERGWALLNEDRSAELSPFSLMYLIRRRRLPATLDSYFSGVPLTVHAVAYDIRNDQLVGDIGLDAIKQRVISVNNICSARYSAGKKGIPLKKYIKNKADELGFKPIYP